MWRSASDDRPRARRQEAALTGRLEQMAGFRNVVVHLYQDVDLGIVRDVVENHLGDRLDFVAAIRRGL